MKKTSLLAIALSALVAFAGTTFAADNPQPKGKGPSVEERLKNLADALKLTDEQKAKIEPIMKEEGEKLRGLFQDQNSPREEKMKKAQEIRKDISAKIKPILTAEQVTKYEKLLEEQAAKRKKQ